MAKLQYNFQLRDLTTGQAIISSGGKVYVAAAGAAAKASLTDKDGSALSNPLSLTRGSATFFVADTIAAVDLYIQAPGGQWVVAKNIGASGPNEINVDTARLEHTAVIPFSIADTTATTETNTGFTVPNGMMLPTPFVNTLTADSTEDIDVGTLSSDSGDADGFMDGVSVGSTGLAKGTLLASGDTMGALFSVLDSANAGDDAPEGDVSMIGKAITYTLSAGSDTAEGFIHLPYRLAA